MRKIILAGLVFMLVGCSSAVRQSEFFQHDTVYKDLGHLWFSNVGHLEIDANDVNSSRNRQWWGITKPYPPAK